MMFKSAILAQPSPLEVWKIHLLKYEQLEESHSNITLSYFKRKKMRGSITSLGRWDEARAPVKTVT